MRRVSFVQLAAALVLWAAGVSAQAPPAAKTPEQTSRATADARVMFDFQQRVKAYIDLHNRLEGELPRLADQSNATQLRTHQHALAEKLRVARRSAKVGDFFTTDVRHAMRRAIARTLGPAERRAILNPDTNPLNFTPKINTEYPSALPVSTMPPNVLQSLPAIAEEVEYRFVGKYLILRDTHADIIIDFMKDAVR